MIAKTVKILGLALAVSLLAGLPVLAGGHSADIPAYVMVQLQRTCVELNVPTGRLDGLDDVKPLLSSSNERIRAVAVYTLGESHDSRAVKPLLGMLNDSDHHVRRIAATALGKLGDRSAVEGLVVLLEGNQRVHVKAAALDALAQIGGERSLAVVARYTDSQSGWLRRSAVEAKQKLAGYQRDLAKR